MSDILSTLGVIGTLISHTFGWTHLFCQSAMFALEWTLFIIFLRGVYLGLRDIFETGIRLPVFLWVFGFCCMLCAKIFYKQYPDLSPTGDEGQQQQQQVPEPFSIWSSPLVFIVQSWDCVGLMTRILMDTLMGSIRLVIYVGMVYGVYNSALLIINNMEHAAYLWIMLIFADMTLQLCTFFVNGFTNEY